MTDYKLAPGGGVLRAADNAVIPEDVGNRDWNDYLDWVTAGGVVDPADKTDLELAKEAATRRVEGVAAKAAFETVGTPAEQAEFRAAEFEAMLSYTGARTNDAELPLLVARITGTLTTTIKTAGDVIDQSEVKRGLLAVIMATRKTDLASIVAAVSVGEVEAVAPHVETPPVVPS